MKKEDFKDIFNHVYMESAEKIMERVDCCVGVACLSCPFDSHNNPKCFSCKDITKIGKYSTKYNLAKAFKSMVEEEKRKDFKVGDKVRVIVDNDLKNKTGELRHINNHSAIVKFDDTTIDNTTILFRNLEKIKGKQKKEPFELKEGMKVVSIDKEIYIFNGNEYISEVFETEMIGVVEKKIGAYTTVGIPKSRIDWEETRKLNEVKEEPKEESKKSITITLDLNKQQELLKRTKKALDYLNNCIEEIEKDYFLKDKIKIKVEIGSVE